jgi:ATPase subunit of ABC transporter with duplicated ATPase domains
LRKHGAKQQSADRVALVGANGVGKSTLTQVRTNKATSIQHEENLHSFSVNRYQNVGQKLDEL